MFLCAPEKPLFTNNSLKKLLIPLIIEQALAVSVGVLDTMMVSSAGEAAVSGVSLVDMLTVLIINLFAALATGGAVVVSQYIGARESQNANDSASQLLLLSAILGGIVGLSAFIFAPFIMQTVYGTLEPDVYAAGLTYLRICSISFPFLAVYNGGAAIFRSTGNSKISMRVSILMNIINLFGNAICIYGLRMGVRGVAIPSVISRIVAATLIVIASTKPNPVLTVSLTRKLSPKLVRRILQIGIPSAFENSLFQGGRILVVGMIAGFGTIQITANAVANNIDALGCIPGQAISLGMIAVVGRCVGARDEAQTIYFTKKLMVWAHAATMLMNGIVLLCLPLLLGLYDLSSATTELSTILVWIHAGIGFFVWPLAFVLPNALRAANDIRYTMTVSILSMLLFRIVLSYILAVVLSYGVIGLWAAMIVDWAIRIIFFVWRFYNGKWKDQYAKATAKCN